MTHRYIAPIVAHMCRCYWCRLATAFAAHINGTLIAIWASTWYFGTVSKAQASLCKWQTRQSLCRLHMIFRYCVKGSGEPMQMADSPEPLPSAHDILVLIALSSDFTAHDSLRKCADLPGSSLLVWAIAHKSPFEAAHEILVLWRRFRLPCANVQTRPSLRCSHKMAFNRHLSQHMCWFKFWASVYVPKPHVLAQVSIFGPFIESAHVISLVWAFVDVQRFHVLAQMVAYGHFVRVCPFAQAYLSAHRAASNGDDLSAINTSSEDPSESAHLRKLSWVI